MRWVRVAAILAALLLSPPATAQYAPTALPPLPGDGSSSGSAINAAGEVVGVSLAQSRRRTAVVWDPDGNPTALPCLPGDVSGSHASDINAAGEIVGDCLSSGVWVGMVWRRASGKSR